MCIGPIKETKKNLVYINKTSHQHVKCAQSQKQHFSLIDRINYCSSTSACPLQLGAEAILFVRNDCIEMKDKLLDNYIVLKNKQKKSK